MKIYGPSFSPFVSRVRTLLHHKGLSYEQELPPGGSTRSEAYLKINPIGKVPTLIDGGVTLPESEVICEYLEEKYPQKPLLPAGLAARGKVRLINRVGDIYIVVPMFTLFPQLNPATRDQALADTGLAGTRSGLAILESFMEGEDYAVGGALTLADCGIPPILFFVHYILSFFGDSEPLTGYPKLDAYWMNMSKHPVVGPILDDMDTTFKAMLAARNA
jgi:glutathione S-transferase